MIKPTFLSHSLGCRTNQAEMYKISRKLSECGFLPTQKNPDIVLLNTCVVTAKAERETRKAIRRFRRLFPSALLVVLGCGVEAERKLGIDLPKSDFSVGNSEKEKVIDWIIRHFSFKKGESCVFADRYTLSHRVFCKIQEGCDRFCTYCLVPFLRGDPKSIPLNEVIRRIKEEEKRGVKEVVLTGTNLALWGREFGLSLKELLLAILERTAVERISLSSIDPSLLDEEFVCLFLANRRLSSYFHLALQSGSSSVLMRMGRRVDLERLLSLLLRIRKEKEEFVFRADILVGFPQESEEEFWETVDFLKAVGICFAHVFPFSPRRGTEAVRRIQQREWCDLPSSVKKQRVEVISKVVAEIREREGRRLIGKCLPCLFIQKRDGFWLALAPNSWKVKVKSSEAMRGQIRRVKMVAVQGEFLLGEGG